MAWNNEDLGAWMIKADFPGSWGCGTVCNGTLITISFIKKNQQLKTRKQDYQRSGIQKVKSFGTFKRDFPLLWNALLETAQNLSSGAE